jgi:putative ABC transport system permease protein
MSLSFLLDSVEQGLVYGVMALGVYLTYRILNFADLTVDGSFPLGASVAARLIVSGANPLVASIVPMFAGALAGLITGLLHTKARITGLLAGILTMTGLYSVNLRIMGRSNISLLRKETVITIFGRLPIPDRLQALLLFLGILIVLKLIIDQFLFTEIGLALRATGDNSTMIRSLGTDTNKMIVLGLMISNALISFSGGLVAQYQGFSDVSMGIGTIVAGLASVIVGQMVLGSHSIVMDTIAVIVGSILYRVAIGIALSLGLQATDLKAITALLVIAALTTPQVKRLFNFGGTAPC